MSPLQSLMVLHGSADDPARRYISRVQQAVRILYGSASPSEAFESSALNVQTMLGKIFKYGVSDQPDAAALGNRGQGLFVPKTYMAKMGSTITYVHEGDTVRFDVKFARSGAAA